MITVGRVARAHGIRGEVVVDIRTDDVETRFAPGTVLMTAPASTAPASSGPATNRHLTVRRARWHSGRLLVTFDGIPDRDAAEELRGARLQVEIDPDAETGDPDEFFDHQLVGLTVEAVDGSTVGPVADVIHLPGQDLLAVDGAAGEVLIPFVTAIVPTVDLTERRIVVDPPPGLLDADEAIRPDPEGEDA